MSWTMADPADNPQNYLPSPLWNIGAPVQDPTDSTGATWTITGSYTGSWTGNAGSAVTTDISLESTAKFTINSFSVTGQASAGACAPAPPPPAPNPPAPSKTATTAPSSTGTYVAAGVGVVGVGAAIWYFFIR